jgi:medium-chain acyl-[acyl-carrier-protein] hydrolase
MTAARAEKITVAKKLPTYQIGRDGTLRPVMLMNEFQAMADMHANILGVGREYCAEHNIGWVVTHYMADIKELPNEREEIRITTWPARHEGVKAIREFEVRGADGRLMVSATSQWIVINLETRRPLRLAEAMPEWEYIPERALEREFDKLPDFESPDAMEFRVRNDDIDINRHVNNAVYTTWATESLGAEFLGTHRLCGLRINFKKEIGTDTERVRVIYRTDGDTSKHMITSGSPDAPTIHAVVELDWH